LFNANADENGMIGLNRLPTTVILIVISSIGFETKPVDLTSMSFDNGSAIIYLDTIALSLRRTLHGSVP
jgi:uncharacterized phosphosugar-binding protein